jgi:hypothetical protein
MAIDTSEPELEVTVTAAVLSAKSLSGIEDPSALYAAALKVAVTAPATLATAGTVKTLVLLPLVNAPVRVQVMEPELSG